MTKQEVLEFAASAVADDSVETLVVVAINKNRWSDARLSAYGSGVDVVYAVAGVMRYVIDMQEKAREITRR